MRPRRVTIDEARMLLAERPKRSKFNVDNSSAGKAARTMDGIVFDSIGEMKRWAELKTLAKSDHIRDLARQVPITLAPKANGLRVVKYVTDFHYFEYHKTGLVDHEWPWCEVYEDYKGFDTPMSRLKRNLAARKLPEGAVLRITHADGTREDFTR